MIIISENMRSIYVYMFWLYFTIINLECIEPKEDSDELRQDIRKKLSQEYFTLILSLKGQVDDEFFKMYFLSYYLYPNSLPLILAYGIRIPI